MREEDDIKLAENLSTKKIKIAKRQIISGLVN